MKRALDELRTHCGDSGFGYRMQALFAHVLILIGGHILEVNAQGHPDIKARLGDREVLVQVKSLLHRSSAAMFEISPSDVAGIAPTGRREGLLAVLDCAEPVRWIVLPSDRAALLVGRNLHIATLRAESDLAFSNDCTNEFTSLLSATGPRLQELTYSIIRRRALAAENL